MKRLLIVFTLMIISIAFLCGCGAKDTQSVPAVVINYPEDTWVNGYRTQSITEINTEESKSKQLCGNKNSKVFHDSECGSLKKTKDENKVYISSRQEFIDKGYKPCSRCKP